MNKGANDIFSYPFSLFINLLEANISLDENEFKKGILAVRMGRFMSGKELEKFMAEKKDTRSDLEKLNDFQKKGGVI